MHPGASLADSTVTVELEEVSAAGSLISEAQERGGFMLVLDTRPTPFETYSMVLRAPGGFEFSFEVRVMQIFDQEERIAAAFQIVNWEQSKQMELDRKLSSAPEPELSADAEHETRGTAPIFRIKGLDPGKKIHLATRADRAERKILCRDSSPQVLLSLLSNPRIDSSDVLQIVKSTHASAGVLQRVAKDRRWMSNSEIQSAVVRNPKTPAPIAIQLLESLPINELRSMARMGSLREAVRRAAFRAYQKRSSRRR